MMKNLLLPCTINWALASAVSTPLLATHVYVPVSNVYVAYMVREWSTSFLEHRCARSKSINQPSFVQSTFKFSTSWGSVVTTHVNVTSAPATTVVSRGGVCMSVGTVNEATKEGRKNLVGKVHRYNMMVFTIQSFFRGRPSLRVPSGRYRDGHHNTTHTHTHVKLFKCNMIMLL